MKSINLIIVLLSLSISLFSQGVTNNTNGLFNYSIENLDPGSGARTYFNVRAYEGSLSLLTYGKNFTGTLAGMSAANSGFIRTASSSSWSLDKLVIGTGTASPLYFITGDQARMVVEADGLVKIANKLEVPEIEVKNISLPDYVFAEDYNLRSLKEVEEFIEENSHLPEVPSANEVAENGMNLTEMNNAMLKKIEELTLYLIQQQKEIIELKTQVSEIVK